MATPANPAGEERVSGIAIFALVASLVASFALFPRLFPSGGAGPLSGKDAPDVAIPFVLNAPGGAANMSLGDLRGHPVLIDFWASWCGPCQRVTPIVDRIAHKYEGEGLRVIGVNTSDEAGNAAPFALRRHLSYPIAYDDGQRMANAYKVDSLPTLVLISKTGKIVAMRTGDTSDAELDALVRPAL